MVFISAGVIQTFNELDFGFKVAMPEDSEKLTFDASLYFMIVTVTTVGYGDIKPASDSARMIISLFIILTIIILTKQTSDLYNLMKVKIFFIILKFYEGNLAI